MKNILLIISLFTLSSFSYSQTGKSQAHCNTTEVGRVERYVGNTYALYTLSFIKADSEPKVYVLTFTNENTLYGNDKSLDLRTLKFTATQGEFDNLYVFLQQGFNQSEIRSLKLGAYLLKTITLSSRFLYIKVDFKNQDSAMLRVSESQLAKLFGKK